MAVRFDANADRLTRTTNVPATNSVAFGCYVNLTTSVGGDAPIFSLDNGTNDLTLEVAASSASLQLAATGGILLNIGTLVVGRWYYIGITSDGTNLKSYLYDTTTGTFATASLGGPGALTVTNLYIGGDGFAENPRVDIFKPRVWDVATLVQADFAAELRTQNAVITTGLNSSFDFAVIADKLLDTSGNARNLTAAGAGPWQTEADPPTFTDTGTGAATFGAMTGYGEGTGTLSVATEGAFDPELSAVAFADSDYDPGGLFETDFIVPSASGVTGTGAATFGAMTGSASGSSVTGTGAANLGAMTGSAAGAHGVAGTAAATFGAMTGSAAGSSTTGTAAATLGAMTGSAAGAHGVAGTAAATLGAMTGAAAGSSATGAGASTLGVMTGSASGSHGVAGTAAAAFAAMTGAASGLAAVVGVGSSTFGAMTGSGTGFQAVSGDGAATFGAMTGAAMGVVTVSGAGAAALGAMSGSAAGAQGVAGTASSTFAGMTGAASGAHGVSGAGAVTFSSMTGAAAGAITGPVTGDGTATFAPMSGAASGGVGAGGSGSATFADMQGAASGTHGVTGTGAALFDGMTGTASGTIGAGRAAIFAQWRCDDTDPAVIDEAAYPLAVTGAVPIISGKIGQAREFDLSAPGVFDPAVNYARRALDAALAAVFADQCSLSLWLKRPASETYDGTKTAQILRISKGAIGAPSDEAHNTLLNLFIERTTEGVLWAGWQYDVAQFDGNFQLGAAAAGAWTHLAITRGPGPSCHVLAYVDGVQSFESTMHGPTGGAAATQAFMVGGLFSSFDGSWHAQLNAALDDMRLYRGVLTARQVAGIYAQGLGTNVVVAPAGPSGATVRGTASLAVAKADGTSRAVVNDGRSEAVVKSDGTSKVEVFPVG